MFRINTMLPLLARNMPRVIKRLIIPTFFTIHHVYSHQSINKFKCLTDPFILSETISYIERNIIRIELNGDLVGMAYCFAKNYLVSVRFLYFYLVMN